MIDEQLEFQISQYVDGTLPASEKAALEARLASDADARAMLTEYRRLDAVLKSQPAPSVKWDRLARHLSDVIAAEPEPVSSYKIGFAQLTIRVAIAAVIILTVGIGLRAYLYQDEQGPASIPVVAIASVTGPAEESATGVALAQVEIGPSALAASDAGSQRFAGVISRGATKVIIAAGDLPADSGTRQ